MTGQIRPKRTLFKRRFEAFKAEIGMPKAGLPLTWTDDELARFDQMVEGQSSRDQLTRLEARMDMAKFVQAHSKEKCDAMFAHLESISKKR